MEKSYIVAYTMVCPGYAKTKFDVFTEKDSAIFFYKGLQGRSLILGSQIYESFEVDS